MFGATCRGLEIDLDKSHWRHFACVTLEGPVFVYELLPFSGTVMFCLFVCLFVFFFLGGGCRGTFEGGLDVGVLGLPWARD